MNRRELLSRALTLVPPILVSGSLHKAAGIAAQYLVNLQTKYPQADADWKFYECGGQILFSIYGPSGSLSTQQVCYLIRPKLLKQSRVIYQNYEDLALGRGTASLWGWEALAIGFNDLEFMAAGDDEKAIQRLVNMKIEYATAMGKPVTVNLDGGELPLPE